MGFTESYLAYLTSPEWRKKRDQYWNVYGRFCQGCASTVRLEVDHLTYERLGHELLADLVGLCHSCHERVTIARREFGAKPGDGYKDVTERVLGITFPLMKLGPVMNNPYVGRGRKAQKLSKAKSKVQNRARKMGL